MSSSSVWVQLCHKGEETNDRDPVEIIPTPRNIGALKAVVLPELGLWSLSEAKVHFPGTTPGDKALNSWDQTPSNSLGPHPLIVVAPGAQQPANGILDGLVQRKRARTIPDGDNEHNLDQDSKPCSSSGAAQLPGSDADSSSERNDSSGQQSNQHGTRNGGSAPMSMASALSLFAPPADRDVANELDLLDVLDPDEQHEIVKSFAMKHIVPRMRC